jgi:hypothetical protein
LPYPDLVSTNGKYPEPRAKSTLYRENVHKLHEQLISMDSDIDDIEAKKLARAAIGYSMSLANDYRITRPAKFHNTLVNLKIKDRGLCIHWTKDLLKLLRGLNFSTFEFHWGVARPKSILRVEHSSVVVTAKGQPFDEGIVLDPWRYGGKLYWIQVRKDEYNWKKLKKTRSQCSKT